MIRLRLSERQRRLLADHTYPFPELEEQLTKLSSTNQAATVTIEPFYLDRLLADIVYSSKRLADDRLVEELDDLYTRLEMQAKRQGYAGC